MQGSALNLLQPQRPYMIDTNASTYGFQTVHSKQRICYVLKANGCSQQQELNGQSCYKTYSAAKQEFIASEWVTQSLRTFIEGTWFQLERIALLSCTYSPKAFRMKRLMQWRLKICIFDYENIHRPRLLLHILISNQNYSSCLILAFLKK